jgi:hypothetical protein
LARLGVRWEQAKRWITPPDREYERKKGRRDRLMSLAANHPDTWAVGFCDERWWSRLALPSLNSWAQAGKPMCLILQSVEKDELDPRGIYYYELYLSEFEKMWLRFVDGRPVSAMTTRFLSRCSEKLAAVGKKVWLLILDNESWHISREVREWIASHNHWVKRVEME